VRTLHWCYNNENKLRVSKRKSEIQDDSFENLVAQILADKPDCNEMPTSTPMFPGSGKSIAYWEFGSMSGHVGNQRWRPLTGR